MVKAEQTDGREPMAWSDVDWAAAEAVVRRIQNRIFRAAKAGDGARVKNLQKAARPLPVREAAGDPSGDPAQRGQEHARHRRRGVHGRRRTG